MAVEKSKFTSVGFDIGGVILTAERQNFLEYCQDAFGVPTIEIETAIARHLPALERADILLPEFWQRVTASLGVDYEPEKTLELWTKHYVEDTPIRTELLEMSDRLRQGGYKTGLLSNTHAEHIALNQKRHFFERFDVVCLSSQIRAIKPEPEAYLAFCKALDAEPSQVIFIDDLTVNAQGAAAVGMVGIEYKGYEPLVQNLNHLGVNV